MRQCIFLTFIFLSSLLSADITPYLTSENDTLALVEGIVNTYNGKLVQIDQDLEIQGSDPLQLVRYYDGGHHFVSQYGYGIGFSLPIVLVFDSYNNKHNVLIEQRGGSYLLFNAEKKGGGRYAGKIAPEILKAGYTNCCESLLRGESDISAIAIEGTKEAFVVNLGNGTKRHYTSFYHEKEIYYYRLVKEERSSGNTRQFEYTDPLSISPKRIWTTNKSGSLILNWIAFDYQKESRNYTVTASNGQQVHYNLEHKKGTAKWQSTNSGHKIKYNMHLLKNVSGDHLLTTHYEPLLKTRFESSLFSTVKIRKPDGRLLEIEYDKYERVQKLFLSGEDTPLYTFDYHKEYTIVTDALGYTKRFDFKKRRLTKLTEHDRTQHYDWSEEGKLLAYTLKNLEGRTLTKRTYVYDSLGNIIETKVVGNITGIGPDDSYVVRYTYSKDGKNLLLSENHNSEREFSYAYLPGTNLLTRKLTFADRKFVEREFYTYDENGILIEKIVDDGTGPHAHSLKNVTYRRITEITPQLNPNLPGMTLPHFIKEWYIDPETGKKHLLKIIEKIYTQGDLLQEEKVYDANEEYRCSTFFEYNSRRELTREVNCLGEETVYRYDENGNKVYEEKLGSGKRITYCYDLANRLIQKIEEFDDAPIAVTSHTYDAMSRKSSTTNRFNQTTTFQYDGSGRKTVETDPLSQSIYREYDPQGNLLKEVDQERYATSTTYNFYGKPLEITYADGTTEQFAYNLQGDRIQQKKRDGTLILYKVDYQGRPTEVNTYDVDGNFLKKIEKTYKGPNITSEMGAMGNLTSYKYDGAGRKTAKIKGSQATAYTYDSLGRLSQIMTPDATYIKEYDLLERLIEERVEDQISHVYQKTTYSYDHNGNRTSKKHYVEADQYVETRTLFNGEDLPIMTLDAEGNATTIAYHYSDHLKKETTDPKGRKKVEVYDALNRCIETRLYSSEGELLSYRLFDYDGRSLCTLQTEKILYQGEELGNYEISTTYNEMGEKTSQTEQQEKTKCYRYKNGKLFQIVKPDGVTLTYFYDPLGRVSELFSSDGTIHYRYTYDGNNNLLKVEDLVQNSVVERSYDTFNRLILEKQAVGFDISYFYDSLNRLTDVKFQKERLSYTYSPTTLLAASRYKDDTLCYTFTQQVDWRGKTLLQTLPNGMTISYQWDRLGRCSRISSDLFRQSFTYDATGNMIHTEICDPLGSYEVDYTYDALDQITAESGPLANQYAFDSLNNRRELNGESYTINTLNQLTNDSTESYTYDKNGNRIAKGKARYSYDALDRLIKISLENNTIHYKYDPFGRRIERSDASGSTHYIYQFETEIGTFINGEIKELRTIHGEFSPFAIELQGELFTPIRNHRGDLCLLLNQQRDPIAIYRYDAFGTFLHEGSIESPWLFSGQRYDKTTKLYHFAKREYDPFTGRWLTPDPLGFADGVNLYAYVHNNPMIYVDPYGLWGESLYNWYNQSKQFASSFTRGFMDDTTFGASSYMLGQHHLSSLSSKVGYYAGTGCSMAAGLMYGSTLLKGVRYGGKAAINAYKFTRNTYSATKATKNVMAARNVVKLTHEAKPLLQKVSQAASPLSIMPLKEFGNDWAKLSNMLRNASKGKGNFGIGKGTTEQAAAMGKAWVGNGYKVSSNGKAWVSADGMKQFRLPSYKPHLNRFQANFERKFEGQVTKRWQANAHLDIFD